MRHKRRTPRENETDTSVYGWMRVSTSIWKNRRTMQGWELIRLSEILLQELNSVHDRLKLMPLFYGNCQPSATMSIRSHIGPTLKRAFRRPICSQLLLWSEKRGSWLKTHYKGSCSLWGGYAGTRCQSRPSDCWRNRLRAGQSADWPGLDSQRYPAWRLWKGTFPHSRLAAAVAILEEVLFLSKIPYYSSVFWIQTLLYASIVRIESHREILFTPDSPT